MYFSAWEDYSALWAGPWGRPQRWTICTWAKTHSTSSCLHAEIDRFVFRTKTLKKETGARDANRGSINSWTWYEKKIRNKLNKVRTRITLLGSDFLEQLMQRGGAYGAVAWKQQIAGRVLFQEFVVLRNGLQLAKVGVFGLLYKRMQKMNVNNCKMVTNTFCFGM